MAAIAWRQSLNSWPEVSLTATAQALQTFDAACKELHDDRQPEIVQELIARRIIAAAHKGERDVTRLRDIAPAALRNTRTAK